MNDKSSLLRERLFQQPEKDYGPKYQEHLVEQYRLYLEMADQISSRRQSTNSFFLSINTGVLALLGILANINFPGIGSIWLSVVCLAGATLCYLWYRLIRSYRDLNTAKFAVIHELETKLPVAPYDAEWVAVGKGKNKKLYWPSTHVEIAVPWVFIILYSMSVLFLIVELVRK